MNKLDRVFTFFVGLFFTMYWTSFALVVVFTFLDLVEINFLLHFLDNYDLLTYMSFSLIQYGLLILLIFSVPSYLLHLALISVIIKDKRPQDSDLKTEILEVFGLIFGFIGTIIIGYLIWPSFS